MTVFVFFVVFLGLVSKSFATTCSADVDSCLETLYVTASCDTDNNVCTCADGYVAITSGCASSSTIDQPTITSTNAIFASYSGEVLAGQAITLTCTADYVSATMTYEWYNDDGLIDAAVAQVYAYTAVADEVTHIKCLIKDGELESSQSKAFNVTGYAQTGTLSLKPTVSGTTDVLVTDTPLVLTCDNIPLDLDNNIQITWTVGTTETVQTTSQTYIVTSPSEDEVFCQVTETTAYAVNLEAAKSNTVTLPASVDIVAAFVNGVTVTSDFTSPYTVDTDTADVVFTCAPVDDVNYDTDDVTWAWTVDGNEVEEETAITFSFDTSSDVYSGIGTHVVKCQATPGDGTQLESENSFSLVVSDSAISTASVVQSPSDTIMAGNILMLRCLVTADSLDDVTYSWTLADVTIPGQTDNTLQIYGATQTDNGGDYKCKATNDGVSAEATAVTVEITDVTAVKPVVTSSSTTYGVDETYTLTCEVTQNPESYDLTYTWIKGTDPIADETGPTLEVTATDVEVDYSCQGTFENVKTAASDAETVTGRYVLEVSLSGPTSPVVGTSPTYECSATVASGSSATYLIEPPDVEEESSDSFTFDPVSAENEGDFFCTVTAEDDVETDVLALTPVVTPATPTVEVPDQANVGGSYTLTCDSASAGGGVDATYAWTHGTTTLDETSSTLELDSITDENGGQYSCTITINEQTSTAATAVTLTVGASFGLQCTAETDCTTDYDFDSYTGNCVAGYCECADGVDASQDMCGDDSDGATAQTASILFIIMAALGALLF